MSGSEAFRGTLIEQAVTIRSIYDIACAKASPFSATALVHGGAGETILGDVNDGSDAGC